MLDWFLLLLMIDPGVAPSVSRPAPYAREQQVPPASETPARPATPVSEQILVTANRRETDLIDVPHAVEVLSADDLRKRKMARTLPEALQEVAGVAVQKTSHGQGSPYIRGFTGFRTLLLTDGIRLNNSVFRDGPNQYWSTVDPLHLESLEVVKGPASVLYGSDAIGGAVNAISTSLDGIDSRSTGLYYRGATAESSNSVMVETAGVAGDRTRYRIGGSFKDYGDLRAGGSYGRQARSGYGERGIGAKVQFSIRPQRKLVLLHERSSVDDAWRTHRTLYARPWKGTTVGTDRRLSLDQSRSLSYVQWHDSSSKLVDRVDASLSYQVQKEDQNRVRSSGQAERQGFDVATSALWITVAKAAASGFWTGGVELYRDRVNSFSHRLDAAGNVVVREIQGPVGDDAAYDVSAIFLQDEIPLSGRLTLTAGARWTAVAADARAVRDPQTGRKVAIRRQWRRPTGTIRFLVTPVPGSRLRLFGGASQGFRAPNLSDLTRYDIARSRELETPSGDLEPESFLSLELGARIDGPRFRTQLAVFRTGIDGQIIRVPTGRQIDGNFEVRKENAADGRIAGAELSASFEIGAGLRVSGGGSLLRGRISQYAGSQATSRVIGPIDKLAPPGAFMTLSWRPSRWWLEASAMAVRRQDDLSTGDRLDTDRIPPGGTPGYGLLTLRGGIDLTPRVMLSGAIENLTDRDYRVHGSGINGPGRNAVFAAGIRF